KSRDRGCDIVPGRLRLQGRFDRLAQERIREWVTALAPALRLRQDRTWVFGLDERLFQPRLAGLSIHDVGRGKYWGQEGSESRGRRGEAEQQAQPHLEAPASSCPTLVLWLAARLHGVRTSLACGCMRVLSAPVSCRSDQAAAGFGSRPYVYHHL